MTNKKPMRSRYYNRLCNQEIEDYLGRNDVLFIPVGVIEMHGIFPMDVETVIPTVIAEKLAEEADALVLPNLQYFYAGGTEIGRGTVQVNVRTGIDYLYEIATALLKKGFKRQIYLSFHGPAYLTINPVIRDFFDETGVPIFYLDLIRYFSNIFSDVKEMYSVFYGALDLAGRLVDVPLVSEFPARPVDSNSFTGPAFQASYLPGFYGFFFDDKSDHSGYVPQAASAEERQALADKGKQHIDNAIQQIKINEIITKIRKLEDYTNETIIPKYENWL